jgi:hypothetical protein
VIAITSRQLQFFYDTNSFDWDVMSKPVQKVAFPVAFFAGSGDYDPVPLELLPRPARASKKARQAPCGSRVEGRRRSAPKELDERPKQRRTRSLLEAALVTYSTGIEPDLTLFEHLESIALACGR